MTDTPGQLDELIAELVTANARRDAAHRVAELIRAARAVAACQSRGHPEWHRVLTELAAAVDALDQPPAAEPAPEPDSGEPRWWIQEPEWKPDDDRYDPGSSAPPDPSAFPLPPPPPAPEPDSGPSDRAWYAMHDHGPGTPRHSHHISQGHTGDVNNPRANDHSGVERISWAEVQASGRHPEPDSGPGWDIQVEPNRVLVQDQHGAIYESERTPAIEALLAAIAVNQERVRLRDQAACAELERTRAERDRYAQQVAFQLGALEKAGNAYDAGLADAAERREALIAQHRRHMASCIWVDPARMSGAPCLGGTRIRVDTIAGLLAEGMDHNQIRDLYPDVTDEHLVAVQHFVREVVDDDWAQEVERLQSEVQQAQDHSVTLNTIAWKIANALGDVPEGAEQIQGNPVEQAERLIAELATARRAAEETQSRD